jgi:type VI protein secretion system component VasK
VLNVHITYVRIIVLPWCMYVTERMSEVKEVKEAKEIQEVQEVQEAEEEAEDAQIKHGLGKLKLRGVSSCSM